MNKFLFILAEYQERGNLKNKIMKLINENYTMKCEYEKNKDYYDAQLKFVL